MQRQLVEVGSYEGGINRALDFLTHHSFHKLLWNKDPHPWKQDSKGSEIIRQRLGWLDCIPDMLQKAREYTDFADEVKRSGFTDVLLIGMGGSSLSVEVSKLSFGTKHGYPRLHILDSTLPEAVLAAEREINPHKTLFVVSSKSGTTIEVSSAMKYFLDKARALQGRDAARSFVAITDPGTPLEVQARSYGFRNIFPALPDVGGRYSALTPFGLIPAALIGVDIRLVLSRAYEMMEACSPEIIPPNNPAMHLGVVMAELAMRGRDKLTLVLSPEITAFGCWIEQLVAESSGKIGKGILPVEGEAVGPPCVYGEDRFFVYVKHESDSTWDREIETLKKSGFPLVTITLRDIYDLGSEYYRWMLATATACAIMGVNPFDQPDVQESKDNTKRLLSEFEKTSHLPEQDAVLKDGEIMVFCERDTSSSGMGASEHYDCASLESCLGDHFRKFHPGGYFALMAFLPRERNVDDMLERIRLILRDNYLAACTKGYGPRFLHSTGQYHKGGPKKGVFIQLTAENREDAPIPGESYTWGVLSRAQAIADYLALTKKGNPIIRLHLGHDLESDLGRIVSAVERAVEKSGN